MPGRLLRRFAAVSTAVTVVDLVVLAVPLAVAKVVALLVSGVVRFVAYRAVLFTDQRRELRIKRDRPPLSGTRRFTVVLPAYHAADRVAASVAAVRDALADIDTEILVV